MDPAESKVVKRVAQGILGTGATGLVIFMFTTFQQKSDARDAHHQLREDDKQVIQLVKDVKKDLRASLKEMKQDFRVSLRYEFKKLRKEEENAGDSGRN